MTVGRMTTEQLLAQLEEVRKNHGDQAFEDAKRGLAQDLILKPNGETFLKNAFPDMDLEAVRAEAEKTQEEIAQATSPEEMMRRMMQQQIPNLKTQGHYNFFMQAFDALRKTLNSYFGGDAKTGDEARVALGKVLDAAKKIPEIERQLKEMPESAMSEATREFTQPAKELHEFDNQRQLMTELAGLEDAAALKRWYEARQDQIDGIVSKSIRDELFDTIRKRRIEFAKKEGN